MLLILSNIHTYDRGCDWSGHTYKFKLFMFTLRYLLQGLVGQLAVADDPLAAQQQCDSSIPQPVSISFY